LFLLGIGGGTAFIAVLYDAARGTLDVSNHIVQITSTFAETGRMAAEARDSAVHLSQQAETLKREVDAFIVSIRAS